MSDVYMCELEDNLWDDFGGSDDHIVPHHGNECEDRIAVQGDSCKKPQGVGIGVASNAANETKYGTRGKEERSSPILTKKDTMLEKDSWSQTPDGMFPSSCDGDSLNGVTIMESDDTRMPSHCLKSEKIDSGGSEFCVDDSILGEKCAAVENNLYCYPLSNISQTDNDLSFLDNECEGEESNDLLSSWWPNIENFEDVDRMFRSCDSSFGLGSLSNEDDLCWFSSSHAAEVSEDALKSDKFIGHEASIFKSISECDETSSPKSACLPINYPNKKSVSIRGEMNSYTSHIDDPASLGQLSFLNGSDTKTEHRDDLMPKEQRNVHRKKSKNQSQMERKRKDRYLENGDSFHYYGKHADLGHHHGDSLCEVFSPPGNHQHKQNVGPDTSCYIRTQIPCMHLECSHPSDKVSVCPAPLGNKFENSGHAYSPKESSYASNPVQSMESSHCPSFEVPAKTVNEKRDQLCQDLQTPTTRKFKNVDMSAPMEFCHPVSAHKQVQHSENEVEVHSEIEGVSVGIPTDLDSSNVQESSCMSSVVDEISLEATNFRQLQKVMEKLDIRTKLCIRDSLYRLARSAEQRHNCANLIGGNGDGRDASRALAFQETNKCTGFVDMETGTNPIDRSIAHLLFHRPSDASVMPTNNTVSLRSQGSQIHGSDNSPPVMAETQVLQEDSVASADKKC
ncbi:hypothetical protein I3760_05G037200 [Carya illinoinensis]|nr:hypothetical protein I3760_05G037200 [Carya illinoinensis]